MSFSGPTAPPSRQSHLHRQIPADLTRLALAMLLSLFTIAAGAVGMLVSTCSPWISCLVQPLCLLLFPGYLVESLDRNSYAFSLQAIFLVSAAFYFCLYLACFFPSILHRKPSPGRR